MFKQFFRPTLLKNIVLATMIVPIHLQIKNAKCDDYNYKQISDEYNKHLTNIKYLKSSLAFEYIKKNNLYGKEMIDTLFSSTIGKNADIDLINDLKSQPNNLLQLYCQYNAQAFLYCMQNKIITSPDYDTVYYNKYILNDSKTMVKIAEYMLNECSLASLNGNNLLNYHNNRLCTYYLCQMFKMSQVDNESCQNLLKLMIMYHRCFESYFGNHILDVWIKAETNNETDKLFLEVYKFHTNEIKLIDLPFLCSILYPKKYEMIKAKLLRDKMTCQF